VLDGIYPYITFMIIENTTGMYHSNIKESVIHIDSVYFPVLHYPVYVMETEFTVRYELNFLY
jgi:hypothetical protein